MQSVDNSVINYAAYNFYFLSVIVGTNVKNFVLIQLIFLLLLSLQNSWPFSPDIPSVFSALFFHGSV